MKKRLLCVLLSAALLLDVGGIPVSASSAGMGIVGTAAPIVRTAGEEQSSGIGSYAYYETPTQIVWADESFEAGKTYQVMIGDALRDIPAEASGVLQVTVPGSGTVQLTAKEKDNSESVPVTVLLDAGIVGSKGVLREYPNGKMQVEDLNEDSVADIAGKLVLVYSGESENTPIVKDTQGQNSIDISDIAQIDHVAVVDYQNSAAGKIYGSKRQIGKAEVKLGIPTEKTVANGECKFSITWNTVPYASKYIVHRTDASGNPTGEKTEITGNTFTKTGVAGNTKYYYKVQAVANGRSGAVYSDIKKSAVITAAPTMITPAQVKSLKASAGDTQITLSWAKTANATKYLVQRSVAGSGVWTTVGSTTGTSYKCSNLVNGKKYTFAVRAQRTVNGYTVSGAVAYVSAAPVLIKPTVPTGLTVTETASGNKLTWKSSGRVTGFIIYLYDFDKNQYKRLAVVNNATSYIHKGAKSTDRYKYAVRAYRNDNGKYYESGYTEKLVFGKKLISSTDSTVHALYYRAYLKKKIGMFKTQWETSSKNYIRVMKKGTKVTVIVLHPTKPKIRLDDGTIGYTYRGALRLTSEQYTSKAYTRQQAECFVNRNGYSSSTNHLIWVATYPQRVYVFKGSKGKWTMVRSAQCATGKITTPDYPGFKYIKRKQRIHTYGKRFYQYISGLEDGNYFHTRPAYRKSGRYVDSRLGRPLSNGCIRLPDPDASYIYYNCAKGTRVVIY